VSLLAIRSKDFAQQQDPGQLTRDSLDSWPEPRT